MKYCLLIALFLTGVNIGTSVSVKCKTDRDGVEHCWHVHDWSDWSSTGVACCKARIPGCIGPGTKSRRVCSSCGETDTMCMSD